MRYMKVNVKEVHEIAKIIGDVKALLKGYFQKNQLESGIADGKKRTGWGWGKKEKTGLIPANFLGGLWRNLY